MALRCGIVGLPNVGKSTLFNALTRAGADTANYPFTTIEPNHGVVAVHDERLTTVARLEGSKNAIPATVEFVDIAGLVQGASKGEGLGNQFLAQIREVDAIVHVVRCFDDENIAHVSGSVEPRRDIEIIQTELLLKDLETVDRKMGKVDKVVRVGDKSAVHEQDVLHALHEHINAGSRALSFKWLDELDRFEEPIFLLTTKPVLYLANVDEADLPSGGTYAAEVQSLADSEGAEMVAMSADLEMQLLEIDDEDREEYLHEVGLDGPVMDRFIDHVYSLLSLITFFTANEKEARAWPIVEGSTAVQAAGKVHTDFARGFIRAETVHYEDFVAAGSELAAREAGKMRSEGKSYIVKDGDLLLFRFSV
jgi:GTP-binding protein YchF